MHSLPPPMVAPRRQAVQSLILGAVDGITTTFAILSGGVGGNVTTGSIAIIAVSSLLADGVSMGISETLSASVEAVGAREARLGLVCGASFVVAGAMPLGAFLAMMSQASTVWAAMLVSGSVALLLLVGLGVVRGRTATTTMGRRRCTSVVQVVGLGGVASVLAFVAGHVVHLLNVQLTSDA